MMKKLAALLTAASLFLAAPALAAFDKYKNPKTAARPALLLAQVAAPYQKDLPAGFLAQLEAHIAENLQKSKKFQTERRDDETAYALKHGEEKAAALLETCLLLIETLRKAGDAPLSPEMKAMAGEIAAAESGAEYIFFVDLTRAAVKSSNNLLKSGSKVELVIDYYLVSPATGLVYHNTDTEDKSAYKYTLLLPRDKLSFGKTKEAEELIDSVLKKQAKRIAKDIEKTGLAKAGGKKPAPEEEDEEYGY